MKVVLVQKSSSQYDDETGERYHFPKSYLNVMRQAVGDWALFYSPVKDMGVSIEGRGSFFATAQLGEITSDPSNEGLFYVEILPQTYADFSKPVNRIHKGSFLETRMEASPGRANVGLSLRAVRQIPDTDFYRIIGLAWADVDWELPRVGETKPSEYGVREGGYEFEFDAERKVIQQLTNRKIRDPRFRVAVLNAYEKICAITGWSFVNGGGRAEVEAAHIKPVEHKGPNRIKNGLALSGTVHWMFDRGLIGIGDDHEILVSRKVNDVERVRALINDTGKLRLPCRIEHEPHPAFLKWHRDHHGIAA